MITTVQPDLGIFPFNDLLGDWRKSRKIAPKKVAQKRQRAGIWEADVQIWLLLDRKFPGQRRLESLFPLPEKIICPANRISVNVKIRLNRGGIRAIHTPVQFQRLVKLERLELVKHVLGQGGKRLSFRQEQKNVMCA
ncbi:MAG: hypothetical protein ABSA47_05810 [Verrucomicrobiota bacterium]